METPSGGESYNPSYKDHQDILFKATLVELKKEKVRHTCSNSHVQTLKACEYFKLVLFFQAKNSVDYHTTRMFPSRLPTEAERVKELTEGLFDEDKKEEKEEDQPVEEGNEEEEDEEEEKKGNKPKTRQQKRREKARRAQDLKADRQKREKVLEHDFTRLKSIKKQLKAEEEEVEANKAKKAQKKVEKMGKASTLSNYKFEEADLDLKLSDELTGNLRNLKPEGNILTDR